jgi:hypothetical protein
MTVNVSPGEIVCEVAGVRIIGTADNVAAARAALEAGPLPSYPDELTPELRDVLSWPNFRCRPFAQLFRAAGYEIHNRPENEQAFVLHWLTKLVVHHGESWWAVALDEIEAMRQKARGLSQ